MASAAAAQTPLFSAPTFAFVRPLQPQSGLLLSALIHTLAIAVAGLPWWSKDDAPRLRSMVVIEIPAHTPPTLAMLPGISFSGASGSSQAAGKSNRTSRQTGKAADSRAAGGLPPVKALYAGPQEIVSKLPDATNNVQTIRRPDLVAPPKLKFPIRIQSMVMMPAAPAPVLARVPQPAKPTDTGVESKAAPAIENPVMPVPVAAEQPQSATPAAVKDAATSTQPAATAGSAQTPAAASVPQQQESATKAVVVLNAVAVPPETPAVVPNAEISGNFAVAPANAAASTATEGGGATARGRGTGTGNGDAESGHGALEGTSERSGSNRGNGSSPGATGGTGATGSGSAGSGREGNGREGSGPGSGAGSKGPGSGSIPGISISGGSGGRSPSAPRTRPGYGITIISSGRSGGAVRDLGTFGRNEVVYTVYIPMSDAGGGPDWPMQYALADPVAAGNGLVSPPLAIKKVAAEASSKTPNASGSRIFLSATITTKGELRELRLVRPQETGSQIAMDALQQWQFAPAEVNGRAIETKVLIGVTIINAGSRIPPPEGVAASSHR